MQQTSHQHADVLVRIDDAVMTIELNRPERKNALTQAMYTAMAEALESAAQNASVRCVVMQGSASCFTSGNDLGDFLSGIDTENLNNPIARFMWALLDCPVPVIAAVTGYAVGIGTTLLQHCDFVIARHDAVFQMPFVKLALCPEFGASYLLAKIVGITAAKDWLMTGRKIFADEALSANFITSIVNDPFKAANALARQLSQLAPGALAKTKSMITKQDAENLKQAIEQEFAAFAEALRGAEFKEAATAFFEKRPAKFSTTDQE